MIELISDTMVTIRKDRQCYSCLRVFQKGECMRHWVGKIDGDFNSVYSCGTCDQIIMKSEEQTFPEGYVNDMLSKGQTPEELLASMTTSGKDCDAKPYTSKEIADKTYRTMQ